MAMNDTLLGLSLTDATVKRVFDLTLALFGLLALWWLILFAALAARLDTGSSGFFIQKRIGKDGRPFRVIKIRTMRPIEGVDTTVTSERDTRITRLGCLLRHFKVDELPQLVNVLVGDMSFVGPRPDVPGFADELEGDDRVILSVRPGITGPATLKYRDEEALLADQDDPVEYNRTVIWPDKVKINRNYVENYRFRDDLRNIWQTITG